MKWFSIVVSLCLGTAVAFAQAPPQELPSAPSALRFPEPQSPPPAKPAPPQAAPAQAAAAPAPSATPAPSAAPAAAQPAAPATPAGSETAAAGSDGAADDQPVTTITKRVNEVNVVFTVTDKHGRFVKDLKEGDFKVLDDNKPPQRIESFRAETDLPLRVALLVDTSNSIRDRFKFEQESAIEFLNQIIRPKSDRAFVIGFDTTAEIEQDFTDSTEKLAHGIRQMRPGGGTALFD